MHNSSRESAHFSFICFSDLLFLFRAVPDLFPVCLLQTPLQQGR